MPGSIEERARFDEVRYANCWEDADVLCAALRPAPGKRFLSIASGGDNSFALVAEGAQVVAADLSPAQLAVVELKTAAVRRLEHPEALAFLGLRPSAERHAVHARLEGDLSDAARAFWRRRPAAIAEGIVHHGKFERYFALFRRRVLPLVHGRRARRELLAEKSEAERHEFYDRVWDTLRWRLLFRVFFGRFVMGRLGRDREFFRYVEGSVAERILARTRYALTVLPVHRNPYLEYILTGGFERNLPRYLRPDRFAALKENLGNLRLVHGPIQAPAQAPVQAGAKDAAAGSDELAGGFDGFNLSDVFEYLDPALCREVYGALLGAARPGARFAYWNMLVPRSCPPELAGRVVPLADEAERLFRRDMAFFYSAFVLEEAR